MMCIAPAFAMLKKPQSTKSRISPVEEAQRQYEESEKKLSSKVKNASSSSPESSKKDDAQKTSLPIEQSSQPKSSITKDGQSERHSDQRTDQRIDTTQKVLRPGMKESDVTQEPQTWWQRAQQASSNVGKKLEESSLYQMGVKQQEKKSAQAAVAAQREEKIADLKDQSKRSVSREEKSRIEKELKAEKSKRSFESTLKQSSLSKKIAAADRSIQKHENALTYGVGGAAVIGGTAAVVGALAVGIGASAVARSDVMKGSETATISKSSSGETFEEVPFAAPAE